MNKTKAIEEHLKSGKAITSMEAFEKYGATRLAAIVFNLRERGMDILSIPCEGYDRYGEAVRYVRYMLKPEV